MFQMFADIEPVAKARARIGQYGAFTPKKTKEFEKTLFFLIKNNMLKNDIKIVEGPVSVEIIFYFKYPKSYKKIFSEEKIDIRKMTRPDIDNLAKSVLDAMNGVVYKDDGQIWKITCSKVYSEVSGVHIRVIE